MAESTNTRISGPVEIEQGSPEAVALRLMEKIASYGAADKEKRDRAYWLKLYVQCRMATRGYDLESILKAG